MPAALRLGIVWRLEAVTHIKKNGGWEAGGRRRGGEGPGARGLVDEAVSAGVMF